MRDLTKDPILIGQKREEKSQAPGGIQTHYLSVSWRVLYPCVTTTARKLGLIGLINTLHHFQFDDLESQAASKVLGPGNLERQFEIPEVK